jgi:hypothetical protein
MKIYLKLIFALICPLMITLPLYFGTLFMYFLIDGEIIWIFLFMAIIFCHIWLSKFIFSHIKGGKIK